MPWARWNTDVTQKLTTGLDSLGTRVAAGNDATAANLGRLQQTITELTATVTTLSETVDTQAALIEYLTALAPVSAASSNAGGSVPNGSFTTDPTLMPSLTVSTPTGRLKITVSAQMINALVTFSIPGYITAASQVAGINIVKQLSAISFTTASYVHIVDGLPVNTALTVQAECYGIGSSPSPLVGAPTITAEPVA
jgi:hypothetical protein